jgi:hypothetical protein
MAGLYGLAGSDDCAWSGVFVTVRYMVWWNAKGRVDLFGCENLSCLNRCYRSGEMINSANAKI